MNKKIKTSALRRLKQAKENLSEIKANIDADLKKNKNIQIETNKASIEIKKLEDVVLDNPSKLIKYRQHITVPALWVPQQGIRAVNLGEIPPEKITGLNNYIQANINVMNIDGGDLDNPKN